MEEKIRELAPLICCFSLFGTMIGLAYMKLRYSPKNKQPANPGNLIEVNTAYNEIYGPGGTYNLDVEGCGLALGATITPTDDQGKKI